MWLLRILRNSHLCPQDQGVGAERPFVALGPHRPISGFTTPDGHPVPLVTRWEVPRRLLPAALRKIAARCWCEVKGAGVPFLHPQRALSPARRAARLQTAPSPGRQRYDRMQGCGSASVCTGAGPGEKRWTLGSAGSGSSSGHSSAPRPGLAAPRPRPRPRPRPQPDTHTGRLRKPDLEVTLTFDLLKLIPVNSKEGSLIEFRVRERG